ncbi:ANTAR domain-containing protein [Amycolatopsis orientalis]|uniref:ANTAR domain-containing protein n=1 Tax=Amycolatopsis orientalis TaxID=31958 RepID=UPI00040C294E|nr:ANTAR domain-containing protein [Amycolatopsis orientalis]
MSDLTFDEQRRPGFADSASANGAHAAFAFPLGLGAIRLGTLTLCRRKTGSLSPDELTDALALADLSTTALLADSSGEDDQLALWARKDTAGHYDDVHVATGMLTARLDISLQDALMRLRAHAYSRQLPITEVARAVIIRQSRFDPHQE